MKYAVVIAVLLSATGLAPAQNADRSSPVPPAKKAKAERGFAHAAGPLPVVVPQQFSPPQEAYASMPDTAAAAAPTPPSVCQERLSKIAVFQPLPLLVGPGDCGATDAVLMETIILPDQSKVAVMPPATMRCSMAEAIAHWVREDVAPSMKAFGPPLRGLDNFASYDCRGRNNIRAAQLSEHGRADALDVRDFKLADGRELGLTDVNVAKDWREGIRASVCARFSTVLGPGSDGYHEEHIHLDLAERRNNYKVCEWDVREPPPPQARKGQDATAVAGAPASQGNDAASEDDGVAAQEEEAAPIPLNTVPLPRPRPMVRAAHDASGQSAKSGAN